MKYVLAREERVAGRRAILVAIRPHDQYRYGHRIWLDVKTAFPLQTQLIDTTGAPIEQVKFADISLNKSIDLAMTTHIVYSDGLATVSVFIASEAAPDSGGASSIGGSNSFSTTVDGYRVTAVGEVPAITLRQIATTMTFD
ncbi:MAG: MucB/RseB C-terminal domain-containing protein [Woeseiaceae bacterium]